MIQPYHVMLKPRGAICDLDCSYCYYLDKEELYPGSAFRMSEQVLEAFTRHGGEAPDVRSREAGEYVHRRERTRS